MSFLVLCQLLASQQLLRADIFDKCKKFFIILENFR